MKVSETFTNSDITTSNRIIGQGRFYRFRSISLISGDIFRFYRTRVRSLGMLVTNSLTDSLTDSLTYCCLVNLIDVALACEDANSKLVEVVTVADVDAEDHVGNSLL